MDPVDRRLMLGAVGLAGLAAIAKRAEAGSLTPPQGPIAPTGVSTQQLSDKVARTAAGFAEARTPIQSLGGSQTALFVVTQPGAYYLTGNIQAVAGKACIEIQADHVDIDCGGFAFLGAGGSLAIISPGPPQTPPPVRRCIEIYDAAFKSCQACCIDLSSCPQCMVSDCLFDQCACPADPVLGPGAVCRLGAGSDAYDCDVRDSDGSLISVGDKSSINECTCVGGTGGAYRCTDGCCCDGCEVHGTTGVAITAGSRCTFSDNRLVLSGGIQCVDECVIHENELCQTTTGIVAQGARNSITGNCVNTQAAGISVAGALNHIEDNALASVGPGGGCIQALAGSDGTYIDCNEILVQAGANPQPAVVVSQGVTGCLITCNSVRLNGLPPGTPWFCFNIAPGNAYGPIVDVAGVGDMSVVQAAAHPWANFRH